MPLTKEQMREYQRKRRGLHQPVNLAENVNLEPPNPANQATVVNRPVNRPVNRQELRARLDALKAEYVAAQRAQDWDTCSKVNAEREPLFEALWEKEKALPVESRYWFPVRFTGVAIPK